MVQVRIEIEYGVDLVNTELVSQSFRGKIVLNTAQGERVPLYEYLGSGGIEKAQDMGMDWIHANMLEHTNPSCRPLRYLKVAEK